MRNEIDVACVPDLVWTYLVRAGRWPVWYPNSAKVRIEGDGDELRPGARFHWRTFGVALPLVVEEFDRPHRLAWSARGTGVDVHHAWLLSPTSTGCHVLTEESQYGLLARLDHALRPGRMARWHQVWLENLRDQAIRGASSAFFRSAQEKY